VLASLNELARRIVEARMRIEGYEYQSDFARRYLALGKAEGRAEGKAEGKAEAIRVLCDVVGIDWSDERARHVAALDGDDLRSLFEHITRERRWPS
jgi:hypothetical protein